MTQPYGQPEPFNPATLNPQLARQPKPKRPYLPIVAALILAVVAFAGGFGLANVLAPKTTAAAGFGGNFRPNPSGGPRGGGFGGGAAGTIGSLSADQMTVTTASGAQRIVLLTPTTTVSKVTTATQAVTDLTSGETVTIVGTSNPDGSITATRVIVGDLSILGRGGFGGRADASPAASTAP